MNNFPVDIMRDIVGDKGVIIGSDLDATNYDKIKYQFPTSLPITSTLFETIIKRKYVFPPFLPTLLRSMLVGSIPKEQANRLLANYLVRPGLSQFELLDFRVSSTQKLIKIVHKHSLEVLKDFDTNPLGYYV